MKTYLSLGLAALLASPALAQTRLTGNIAGLGTRTIEYNYTRQGQVRTDSVRVVKDHFALPIAGGDDGMGMLVLRDKLSRGYHELPIWAEPGTVAVTGSATNLNRLTASGTLENNLLTQYNRAVLWQDAPPSKSETAREVTQGQQTRQFIQAHLAARTSAYLLYRQTMGQSRYPVADYAKLAQQLTPAVRQSWYGQQTAQRLGVLRNQPIVGRPVADFSMADTAGVKHSLATYRGKYVLLDFWGHWCSPCIKAMPQVKALHEQYAGKLVVIGVAMEGADSAPKWKRAIRQYGVPGLQLSELQEDRGPVIAGYNITGYPTYLLLDPQGRLVARTSDVDEVTKQLAALSAR